MEIGKASAESRKITHGNEIVDFSKAISREVGSFIISQDIDFMGCSLVYVEEKLGTAINDLRWIKETLRAIAKRRKELK